MMTMTRFQVVFALAMMCTYSLAADNSRRAGVDFDVETALDEGVTRFNGQVERISHIGRQQSPLTVDEVVAAIRAWDHQDVPIEPELFVVFRRIAESKRLPPGSQLDFTTRWISGEFDYTVWWVDISVSAPNPD